MKKFLSLMLCALILTMNSTAVLAASDLAALSKKKEIVYNQNAKTIKYAFVFDGPSDKNAAVLEQFKKAIVATTAPEFKASFDAKQVYVGDWTYDGAVKASDKALASDASMVVALGYATTKYLENKPNKKKFVMTIDQYGLKDLGEGFFNPVQQSVSGIKNFKTLVNFKKAAVLMNKAYYGMNKDWNKAFASKLEGIDFTVIPVAGDVAATLKAIPADCDAVVLTPLFNLSVDQRKELISQLTAKKLYTYSTFGKEDVELGALMGTGAFDLDRKVAEALSFSIKNVIAGKTNMQGSVNFYEDELLYLNKDTAIALQYQPHLRVASKAQVISNTPAQVYNLSAIFDKFEKQNLDIERKKLLVKAARRSSVSAFLKYLPSLVMNLQYQDYNSKFAESAKLSIPDRQSAFQIGFEQILYSPALVTNIILKKKGLNFAKHEQLLTEQSVGLEVAMLYVETLILKNRLAIQEEYVKQSRENLAISRVREKMGFCGREESMRWAAQLNINEQNLLDIKAAYDNLIVQINKLLHDNQTIKFDLAPLTAHDPAFFTNEINVINYVTNAGALEKFTQMLTAAAYDVAPELAKLKTAQEMKKAEMAMYYQKFILPDAKLALYHTTLFDRAYTSDMSIALPISHLPAITLPRSELNNTCLTISAQWRPIEGGTKIAEIARIKAELDELKRYEDEAKTVIEEHVRTTINKAIAGYLSIEKNFKAMYAAAENYKQVKMNYNMGKSTIAQLLDAQETFLDSKLAALNSQYVFFKELLWVQRALCSINWTKATPKAKNFLESVRTQLEEKSDINLL